MSRHLLVFVAILFLVVYACAFVVSAKQQQQSTIRMRSGVHYARLRPNYGAQYVKHLLFNRTLTHVESRRRGRTD